RRQVMSSGHPNDVIQGPSGRLPAPGSGRTDAEQPAAHGPHSVGPAQGRLGLALRRAVAGITRVHRAIGKKNQAAPMQAQRRVMGKENGQEVVQVVGLRYYQTEFFQQGLAVFLGTLLAMEAYRVMDRDFTPGALPGDDEIDFGFSDPLPGA